MKTLFKQIVLTTILSISLFNCSKDDDNAFIEPQGISIGSFHEGGVVFYIDETGEHGLLCAINDLNDELRWSYNGTFLGGTFEAIGNGDFNSRLIANSYPEIETASRSCLELDYNGFHDWFLPSKDELNEMYINRNAINATALNHGGQAFSTTTENADYWSSSEGDENYAWLQQFDTGVQRTFYKTYTLHVRAIRSF